ncbi:MAG: BBE domain-containing protein [Thermomicrobiales bacterium]
MVGWGSGGRCEPRRDGLRSLLSEFLDRRVRFESGGWNRRRALYEHFDGLYLSFESTRSIERLYDAFPPATLARLRELKAKYDPNNVFRDNFNIAPTAIAR